MRVLVCDDSSFMRSMLKSMISEHCYDFEVVGEASNGEDALKKYIELKPDLVTMDITMPEVDGLEGLKRIRAFDKLAQVIMVSAMGQQSMVVEAITSGAIDFIVKPFNGERVKEAFNKSRR